MNIEGVIFTVYGVSFSRRAVSIVGDGVGSISVLKFAIFYDVK